MTGPGTLQSVNVADIRTGRNVRGDELGDVRALAASIESVGLLHPLAVAIVHNEDAAADELVLVAGHRRLAAVRSLGWHEVAVHVIDAPAADVRLAAQLVENLQRADLDPLAEAEGIADLVKRTGGRRDAARVLGVSPAHVTKRLALLNLPPKGRAAVRAGVLTLQDGYHLGRLDDANRRAKVLRDVLKAAGYEGGGADDLDAVAPGTAEPIPSYARGYITRAAQRDAADKADRTAARKLNTARRAAGDPPNAVAWADLPAGVQRLDGWNGLPVDYDAHTAEPCHRLAIQGDAETPLDVCVAPLRHDPEHDDDAGELGPSTVRLIAKTADQEAAERRALRNAEANAAAQWRLERATAAAELIAAAQRKTLVAVLVRRQLDALPAERWNLDGLEVALSAAAGRRTQPFAGGDEAALALWLADLDDAAALRVAAAVPAILSACADPEWRWRHERSTGVLDVLGYEDPPRPELDQDPTP